MRWPRRPAGTLTDAPLPMFADPTRHFGGKSPVSSRIGSANIDGTGGPAGGRPQKKSSAPAELAAAQGQQQHSEFGAGGAERGEAVQHLHLAAVHDARAALGGACDADSV